MEEVLKWNSFVGYHWLSGISEGEYLGNNCLIFQIDGRNYRAVEDPDDGYRSYCNIKVSDVPPKNTFEPTMVRCNAIFDGHGIVMNDIVTNEAVLLMGTDEWDDYYPLCVMHYNPENLTINEVVREFDESKFNNLI